MPVLFVGTVANVGHNNATAFKLPPDPGINTLLSPPARLQTRARASKVSDYPVGGTPAHTDYRYNQTHGTKKKDEHQLTKYAL